MLRGSVGATYAEGLGNLVVGISLLVLFVGVDIAILKKVEKVDLRN